LSFGLVTTGGTGGYSHLTPIGVGTGKLFHDHSLLISMRHQDAILKIDRASGEIRWILGEPIGWSTK